MCGIGECNPYCCWEKVEKAIAEERKAIFDNLYIKLISETKEDIIEWCENNLIDDVDGYIKKGGALWKE